MIESEAELTRQATQTNMAAVRGAVPQTEMTRHASLANIAGLGSLSNMAAVRGGVTQGGHNQYEFLFRLTDFNRRVGSGVQVYR